MYVLNHIIQPVLKLCQEVSVYYADCRKTCYFGVWGSLERGNESEPDVYTTVMPWAPPGSSDFPLFICTCPCVTLFSLYTGLSLFHWLQLHAEWIGRRSIFCTIPNNTFTCVKVYCAMGIFLFTYWSLYCGYITNIVSLFWLRCTNWPCIFQLFQAYAREFIWVSRGWNMAKFRIWRWRVTWLTCN